MPETTVPDGGARDEGWSDDEFRFRLFVDSVVDYAMFMLDPGGVVQTWNRGAARLKGWSEEEIVGRHFSTFYRPEDREAGLPERLLAEAREQGATEHRGWRVRKDGTRFFGDVVITAVRDLSGQLTGFGKVTRDLTKQHTYEQAREAALEERQRAAQRLRELDEWRREFISSITHDLKTPIVSIAGFTELLLGDLDDDPLRRRDLLERIRHNADVLSDMVDHLRTHARLEEGRVALQLEPVHLRTVVDDLLRTLEPILAQHDVQQQIPDDLVIDADRQGLDRILANLLSNAARHTAPGTAVRVSGARTDGMVVLTVSDDGPGIPPDLREHVFQRYVGGRRGGTGLGLSIVLRYAELHGGEVALESEPDRGATFRVTLPASGPTG